MMCIVAVVAAVLNALVWLLPMTFLVQSFATKRGGLDITLSILGVVVIAFATYALEDVLNGASFDWRSPVLSGIFGLIGVRLLLVRAQIAYRRGTLLYLRLLYEFMADLHNIAVETRVRGQADHKIISRWINPDGVVGVVNDMTPEVSAITVEAERSLNEDTAETGTQVAPNMFWPAAMAVGYDLAELGSGEIDLIEFLPVARSPDNRRTVLTTQHPSAVASVDWRLRMPNPRDEDDPESHMASGPGQPTVVWTEQEPIVTPKLVLLTVELTGEGRPSPTGWTPDVWGRLAVYSAADPLAEFQRKVAASGSADRAARGKMLINMATKPVEVDTKSTAAIRRRAAEAHGERLKKRATDDAGHPRPSLEDFGTMLAIVSPQDAAVACWSAIRTALHKYPEATIMIVMRVPKSVGLAVGTLLAMAWKARENPGCGHRCFKPSCMNPWTRLVPLNWHDGIRDYQIVRVHRSQQSIDALNASFGQRAPEEVEVQDTRRGLLRSLRSIRRQVLRP